MKYLNNPLVSDLDLCLKKLWGGGHPFHKHVLLPVWTAACRFRGKAFRFFINGVTGEVQGDRPCSWGRIALAVTAAVIVGGIVLAAMSVR